MAPPTAISATPDNGYSFNGWPQRQSATLHPQPPPYDGSEPLRLRHFPELLRTHSPHRNRGTVTGEGNFSHDTLTAISATPDNGYSFSGWSGEGASDPSSASTTVLMDQNRSVSATFPNSYALTLLTGTGGTVTGEGNFSHDTLTAISATPDKDIPLADGLAKSQRPFIRITTY